MENTELFFKDLYKNFNARQIDLVINEMTDDIKWANGMEGGHVHGHDGVREYWTRQFTMVSSNVTPLKIEEENGLVKVQVHQVVHDLNNQLLGDEIVEHIFQLKDGKVTQFDIGTKSEN